MILNLPNWQAIGLERDFCGAQGDHALHAAKAIKGVTLEYIDVGNGVSELIVMAMNALLNPGDG